MGLKENKKKNNISGRYSSKDMGHPVLCPCVTPGQCWGWPPLRAELTSLMGGPGPGPAQGRHDLYLGIMQPATKQRHKSNIFKTNEILTYFAGIN